VKHLVGKLVTKTMNPNRYFDGPAPVDPRKNFDEDAAVLSVESCAYTTND